MEISPAARFPSTFATQRLSVQKDFFSNWPVTSNANIRLFVAIFPPPQLVEQLAKAARSLADDLSPRAVS